MAIALEPVRAALARGNDLEALKLAARYRNLGDHKERIERGWTAHQYSEMYEAMGRNVKTLVADGIAAVKERFGGDK